MPDTTFMILYNFYFVALFLSMGIIAIGIVFVGMGCDYQRTLNIFLGIIMAAFLVFCSAVTGLIMGNDRYNKMETTVETDEANV